MKKFSIVIILIVFFTLCGTFMYIAYMNRVERAFIDVKEKIIESERLSKKFGQAKKVKFNNFMQWTSKVQDEECVKVIVTTEKNKNMKCA